ncbi:hypothetical protein H9Q71_014514, partial [Fusarium xylarioides]
LEFTEFKAEGEWLAEGVETGTKFTGIDLEEASGLNMTRSLTRK